MFFLRYCELQSKSDELLHCAVQNVTQKVKALYLLAITQVHCHLIDVSTSHFCVERSSPQAALRTFIDSDADIS